MAEEKDGTTADQSPGGDDRGDVHADLDGVKEKSASLFEALWCASSLCEKMAQSHFPTARPPLSSTKAYVQMAMFAEISIVGTLGIESEFRTQAKATEESDPVEAAMVFEKRTVDRARMLLSYVAESRDKLNILEDAATGYIEQRDDAARDVDLARVSVAADLGKKALRIALEYARKFHEMAKTAAG